jgi:acetyl esterase/lipase
MHRYSYRMGKILLAVLLLAVLGFGIWFYRLGGPAQLNLADRWYWGNDYNTSLMIETDVAYGSGDDLRQRYDVYHPSEADETESGCGGRRFPTLIFFHGGSWRDGDKDSYAFVGRAFAEQGFYVVVADYRKSPQWRFPSFVEDAARIVADVHRNPRRCADPSRLYLMGHSAGAHIAMLTTLDRKWLKAEGLEPSILAGVIGLAGPYDFYPFTSDAARIALGQWPKPDDTQPIQFARGDAPPLLLLTGDADTTVKPRNSEKLSARVKSLGGVAVRKLYPGIGHSGIIMAVSGPFRSLAPVVKDVVDFTQPGNIQSSGHS